MPYNYPLRFGKYFLTRRIAVGGMAEVFRAKLIGIKGFEKVLAVKRILPEFSSDEEFVQMFVDEARISSNLHHSNIVQVFDFGKVEEAYYIAMEFIDGPNLKNLSQRVYKATGKFPRNVTLFVLLQIAKALDYAHNAHIDGVNVLNLVHRDVSPQNILLSRQGDVKITDFGIAKATIKLSKTQPGKIQGKFSYMSPEQAMGKDLDRRSDIFSLGIIGYELLSGIKLYASDDTRQRYKEVRDAHIVPLSSLVKDLPPEIDTLMMSMLAKDPDGRPQTCAEIVSRLNEYLSDISVEKLSQELGQLVEEHYPPERSDSNVNAKIQAYILGGAKESDPQTQVKGQLRAESTEDRRYSTQTIEPEETTIHGTRWSILKTTLARMAAVALLGMFAAIAYYRYRTSAPPPTSPVSPVETPFSAASENMSPPVTGPMDADLRAKLAEQETLYAARMRELEERVEDERRRAEDTAKELKKIERELEDANVMAVPPRPCPDDMVLISQGSFTFGSARNDPDRNDLVEPIASRIPLQKFCVDRYEFPNRKNSKPKSGVTWSEAQSACTKEAKRLCTQEEWERVCKGPTKAGENRRYPYGDRYNPEICNTESVDAYGDAEDRPIRSSGSLAQCVTREGVFDMSGNVDEWTASLGRFSPQSRVTRGGSSHRPGWAARCSSLRELSTQAKEADVGFRCCKDAR